MRSPVLLALLLCAVPLFCQEQSQQPTQQQEPPPAQTGATESAAPEKPEQKSAKPEPNESPRERAWEILRTGAANKSTERRVKAVGVMALIPNNTEIRKLAIAALDDKEAGVRAAAATTLGEIRARQAIPDLEAKLDDPDTAVVLAVAKALIAMHDNAGYEVYYAVLTGERKATGPFIQRQMKILKDPKQMAQIGIEEGLGFVPFAGMGYTAFKMLSKDEVSPVRAAAARALADDRDPQSAQALVAAVADKNWMVRKAALDAIAKRGDRKLLKAAVPAMDDDKDIVMYTAAAAVVRLTDSRKGKKK